MPIREIRKFPDPILRRKCRKVRRIDDDILKLATDMVETLVDAEGVGLAANQIGILKRVIAIHLPEEEPYWLVNPEIIRQSGVRQIDEGCLSLPGYVGLISRSVSVTARALDQNGSKWRVTADELLAQALEHEIDHLNGIMFMDHLLEHERLREVGEEPEENETHLHDVDYSIEAHHHDGEETHPRDQDASPDLLVAKAKLSEVTPQHSMSELGYDLEQRNPSDAETADRGR
jgi:peptide deformylase